MPARTVDVRKIARDTLEDPLTGERYRLCKTYLCRIENRDHARIGGVRIGVASLARNAFAFKEIRRTEAAQRALVHLHDEQRLGVQAQSAIAGRTLLRSASREYLMLPLMAGDMTTLQNIGGRGKAAAMLMGMRAVLADLAACHARGVAHRDIKPANVLHRGTPESVRLGDFGLALRTDAIARGTGTPHHMAPEQHHARTGAAPGHAPAPADVWGVGATFMDLWVGNPFCCEDSADRGRIHAAYARWYPRTASCWQWRMGSLQTVRFARAFGRLPADVRPLMLALLHPDAAARPSAARALAQVEALLAQTPDHAEGRAHYRRAADQACARWALDAI